MKKYLCLLVIALISTNVHAGVLAKESFDTGTLETAGAICPALHVVPTADGQAMKISEWTDKITFPAKTSFNLDEGTIEFRMKFSVEPAKVIDQSWSIFRAYTGTAHKNGHFIAFGWKTGLMFIVCDKNGQRFGLSYPQIRDWKADEWHQVAVTWKIKNPGESQISMYVDCKLVGTGEKLTIEFDKDAWRKRYELEASEKNKDRKSEEFWNGGVVFGHWGEKLPPNFWEADDISIYDNVVTFTDKSTK